MRFCYLRIALLTSAFAANAFANTAEIDGNLAASRTAASPKFVRDNFAASAVTEDQNLTRVDDESRVGLSVKTFAKLIGRTPEIRGNRGIMVEHFDNLLAKKAIIKPNYHDLGLSNPKGNVLVNINWVRWAYFVCTLSHHFQENDYKFLMTAMSLIYDPEVLSGILVNSAKYEKTNVLVINLVKFADDDIKSRVFKMRPELAKKLSHQEKYTTTTNTETLLCRVKVFIKENARNDMLRDEKVSILISYLSVLLSKEHAVSTGESVYREYSENAALLQAILSLKNFNDLQYLGNLVSIWVDVSVPPSKIVSMLVADKAEADYFSILLSDGPSRNFWLNYHEKYNALSRKHILPDSANANFHQLLQMVFTVAEQESPGIDKAMAYTTLLKLLLSPSSTHLSSSHEFVMKLMSILLIKRTLPSTVLAMLMHGEADADKYTVFFVNKPSKSFWLRYLEKFNAISRDEDYTNFANANFHELLQMLFTVVEQESPTIDKSMAYTTLLKLLLSPSSTHLSSSHEFVMKLMSILLLDKTLPSDVLSMLMHGEANAEKYTAIFVNKSSKSFWLRYLEKYNAISRDEDYTNFANANFHQLLQMLFTVVEQESPTIDKSMAYTTLLKLLLSPSSTHLSSSHEYVIKLMSILLSKKTLPSDVLSMLMHGEADTDKYTIFFVNKPSKSFWMRYLKMYNEASVNDEDSMRIANSDFQRLLVMLHDVKKPESSTDSKFLATSTILKMLIAPENANIIRAQQYKEALKANWLEKRFRPDAVVSLLLLEEKEADYFKILFTDTPSSKYWEDYTNAFYAANPTLGNYKLATLIDVFDVAKLKSILEAALTDETTRNKAESLLALLKWWTNGLNGDW